MQRLKTMNKKILFGISCLLLLVYFAVFIYLNMAKYAQHVDSDIAAAALLGREIWVEKTLTPDDWISSTERFIFGMPTVAALFYGLTGSMQMAAGCASVLIGGIFAAFLYWFLRKLELTRPAAIVSLLALCALPINGLRNEGQMVPFAQLSFFLFADYYAIHSILLLSNIIFYLHMKEQKRVCLRDGIIWLFLFGATTLVSFGSQRCLQMIILPLAVTEAIFLFMESKHFTVKLLRTRFLATGFVGSLVLAFLVSTLYKGQAEYIVYLQGPQAAMYRLFEVVPAAILEGFGVAGNARLGTVDSLMQIMIWAFLALVGYGFIVLCNDKGRIPSKQKQGLILLLTSLGITAFVVVMTSAEAAHNYFLVSWFVAVLVTGILVDYFRKEKSVFSEIILIAVCLFALLNLGYTYKDAITTQDNLIDYEEVADFLIEEGIEYGYAEFWDAGRISMIRDGAVTMGHSYRIEDPQMYWWLTSTKWYPPNLPEQMRTAYVVRNVKKDIFEERFAADPQMQLVYQNQTFSVYFCNTNYITIQ